MSFRAGPGDEVFDALLERGGGGVAEEVAGLVDVGVGAVDVAGLHGELFNFGGDAEDVGDGVNHFFEADGAVAAEVDNFENVIVVFQVIARFDDAGDDVGDVGVVAGGRAVAKHGDFFACEHEASELVDGEVGALLGAEDSEKAEHDDIHVV